MANPDTIYGLHSEQILQAVIEVFHINVSDEEASSISTVGELNQVVLEKFTPTQQSECMTQVVFYRLRRALGVAWGVPRNAVNLQSNLESLIPPGPRKAHWCSLEHALNLSLPSMRYSARVMTTIGALMLGSFLLILIAVSFWRENPIFGGSAVLGGSAIFWITLHFANLEKTHPWATKLPAHYGTVQDVVIHLNSWNYGDLARQTGKWSEAEVWRVLCDLIACIYDTDANALTPETKFADLPDFE